MYLNESLFSDFLKVRDILWVGINFSKAKFTRSGFDFKQETLQHYLHDWNMLILNDQKKYDIRMSFRKPVMQYNLSTITKLNKSLKVNDILTNVITSKHVYSDEQMHKYVSNLELPTTLPYALMFVVESFDSTVKTAAIWVVITQTETHEVVLCEKFLKNPAGIGTRNYWARTFYNVFYDIQSNTFRRWENMVQQ
jgi:hypothetical protein